MGPAADAVVTVTVRRPNSRITGPWAESTVCTRDRGAIRWSMLSQPARVCTAVGVTSQRCTR